MRSTVAVRVLIAAAALAVAVSLTLVERDRDRCQEAVEAAFLASRAPERELLQDRVGMVLGDCSGSQPLTDLAVGLRIERPLAAARLARAAAAREPDSYVAWGVLAIAGPPREAAAAARRARELNPLSASAGGP
jgi:hypothetical protein